MAMIPDTHVGYWQRRKRAASERGRRMAKTRWAKAKEERIANPPDVDADTVRSRELHDRMGKLIIAGTHASLGHVEIRHSICRINGFELWIDGRLVARTGKRKIVEELL